MNKRQKKKQLKKLTQNGLYLEFNERDENSSIGSVNTFGGSTELFSEIGSRANSYSAGITDIIFSDGTIVNISSGQFVTVFDPNKFQESSINMENEED